MEAIIANNAALNYGAYMLFCFVAWGLSLWLYEKATPYREWAMVSDGNKAAAWSIGGVAIALALPLASLAAHADGIRELALWSAVSLFSQILLWFVLSKTALRGLKAGMEKGIESVGMLLGACAVSFGAMIASCVS